MAVPVPSPATGGVLVWQKLTAALAGLNVAQAAARSAHGGP
ncbi:hypothetical protein [Streptomyces sp.]|nr:hypothetical protein [Streptomyces sp.]HET6352824.1 hypothetical protein [Streptomyces sp.]